MHRGIREAVSASIVILLVLALGAAGCSSEKQTPTPPAAAGPQVGGTLCLALPAEPRVLDPAKASAAVDSTVLTYLGAGLLDLNPSGEVVGWLAKDYSVSPDGLTVTFHLKDGVTFSNGEPLTAEDFKWTFERILDPATASPVAASLLAGVKSIEAPDKSTLILRLKSPTYALLTNLCIPGYLQPLNKKAVEAAGSQYVSKPVGVGPYTLKETKSGEYVLLERNPKYTWGPAHFHAGPWYIKEIKFSVIPDQASQIAALESGQISALYPIPTQQWDKYSADTRFQFFEGLAGGFVYVTLNTENPIFADPAVRKALNYAVDRAAVVKSVFQGHALPAYGAYHPALPGYLNELDKTPLYPFNLAKAKQTLEDAGWKDANGDGVREKDGKALQFDLLAINAGTFPLVAELVQAQLKEVGADAKLTTMEQGVAIQNMVGGKYQAAIMQWGWQNDAGDIMYTTLHSSQAGAGLNLARYKNADLDSLIVNARFGMDSKAHLDLLTRIQKHVVENAIQIPLVYTISGYVFAKNMKGIKPAATGIGYTFTDAYFENAGTSK